MSELLFTNDGADALQWERRATDQTITVSLATAPPTEHQLRLFSGASATLDCRDNAFLLCADRADGELQILFASGEILETADTKHLLRWAKECQLACAKDSGQMATFRRTDAMGKLLCIILPQAGDNRLLAVLVDNSAKSETGRNDRIIEQLYPSIATYMNWAQEHVAQGKHMSGLVSALNYIDIGLCVVNAQREVIFSNHAAERLLGERDGLCLRGKLIGATEIAESMKLQVALSHVLEGGNKKGEAHKRVPIVALSRNQGRRPLMVALLPYEGEITRPEDPAAVLCFYTAEMELGPLLSPICQLYGLSPVETRLVGQIASGATLGEAAVAMRIKEQTARSYLKQVFLKTDTRRQADLVRLMLSSLVHTRHDLESELV